MQSVNGVTAAPTREQAPTCLRIEAWIVIPHGTQAQSAPVPEAGEFGPRRGSEGRVPAATQFGNLRRRVGLQRARDVGLRAEVEVTDARKPVHW